LNGTTANKETSAVADSDQSFGEDGHIGERPKRKLSCSNTWGSLWQSLDITQKWLLFVGQNVGYIFVGWTTRSHRKSPQFKSAGYSLLFTSFLGWV